MAQTGYTPIALYYSSTASATPTAGNLVNGELALNNNDGVLYYKDSSGVVQSIASKAGNSGSFTNLAYTGTLTGGTGVVNLGSGQFYKDASGNVLIGTSTAASTAVRTVVINTTQNASALQLSNNSGSGTAGGSLLYGSSGNVFSIYGYTGAVGSETYVQNLNINPNGAVALKGASNNATGIGITFPATQSASSDANTLDDYEEGTFTPVFATDGTQPTYTATTVFGYYTKIGRMVYYNFYIYSGGSGATGGTGNIVVTGLPFSATTPTSYSRGLCGYLSWGGLVGKWTPTTGSGIGWQIVPNSATAQLYANSTTYANGAFEIQGTGFYFT